MKFVRTNKGIYEVLDESIDYVGLPYKRATWSESETVVSQASTVEELIQKNDLCELGIIEDVYHNGSIHKVKVGGRWFDSPYSLYIPQGKYNDYICVARGYPLKEFNRHEEVLCTK